MTANSSLKRQLSFTACSIGHRNGEIMDTLVFILVAVLLPAWFLGTLYLSFFPSSATAAATANSQSTANTDNALTPSALSGTSAGENRSLDNPNQSAQGSGDNGVDFVPNQASTAGGLTAGQNAASDKQIKSLQTQLDAKTREFDQLRKRSMAASKSDSNETADTSRFKTQIADLTNERNQLKSKLASTNQSSTKMSQLDQRIRSLEKQSSSQKTEIRTLQDKLTRAEEAKRSVEKRLLAVTASSVSQGSLGQGSAAEPGNSSPTPAGSDGSTSALEFREWVSSRGSRARLAFLRWEDDRVVVVNKDGKEFRLTLSRLSLADQKYVNGKR